MFGQMIDAISDDFVRYVMHLEVVVENAPQPGAAQRAVRRPRGPGDGRGRGEAGRGARAAANPDAEAQAAPVDDTPTVVQVVRSEHEKLGRNQPCYCGSGKRIQVSAVRQIAEPLTPALRGPSRG